MSNIFPTSYYPAKDILIDWDIVWGYDSAWIINRNFLLSAIKAYVLTGITTSEVAEGTNLYHTEARVTSNATVVALWADKAAKTNVLELDNTTVFTPTADYHPSTKKYVDDSGTNINGITEEPAITSWDKLIFYDASAATNRSIDYTDLFKSSFNIVPWSNLLASSDVITVNFTNTAYEKKKEIEVDLAWTYSISFSLYNNNSSGGATWRIYLNWVATWVEHINNASTTTTNFTENIIVSAGDSIEVYAKISGSTFWSVSLYQVRFNTVSKLVTWTVII